MNYLPRDMERKFLKMSSAFKAVLLTGVRHPLEIKMAAVPGKDAIRAFNALPERGTGAVVCMTDQVFPLDRDNLLVPAGIL